MSNDTQNPDGAPSNGAPPPAGKPVRKPLVARSGGLARRPVIAAGSAGSAGSTAPADASVSSDPTAVSTPTPDSAPVAAPVMADPGTDTSVAPAASIPDAPSGGTPAKRGAGGAAASAASAGASKVKTFGIAGVAAFALFVGLGALYMKKTETGALATQVMGSSSGKAAGAALGEAQCRETNDKVTPLVVDWESEDRAEIEIAMKNGLAVVQYSCEKFQVLADCSIEGKYGYIGTTLKEDVLQLSSADELKANLPKSGTGKSGVALSNDMARGSTLDIAMAMIGKFRSTRQTAAMPDLKGKCEGATHYVRGATIGAFALDSGSSGKVKTAVEMFGAGNTVDSAASKMKKTRDGAIDACRKSDPDSKAAPSQCQAMVRLELVPIEGAHPATPNAVAAAKVDVVEKLGDSNAGGCPKGLVYIDGICTTPKANAAYQCKPKDGTECAVQCEKGDETSCTYLGILLSDHDMSYPDDGPKALAAFQKACDGGSVSGCGRLGLAHRKGWLGLKRDPVKGAAMLKKASDDGDPYAMIYYGVLFLAFKGRSPADDSPLPDDPAKAHQLFERGCNAGSGFACWAAGGDYSAGAGGVPQNEKIAMDYQQRGCASGGSDSCTVVAEEYLAGRVWKKDPQKGKTMLEERCAQGDWSMCSTLGIYQLSTNPLFKNDRPKGLKNMTNACDHFVEPACNYLAALYKTGNSLLGVPKDLEKARSMLQQVCDADTELDGGEACYQLSLMVRAGQASKKDPEAADLLLAKSWASGHVAAAEAYQKSHPKKK